MDEDSQLLMRYFLFIALLVIIMIFSGGCSGIHPSDEKKDVNISVTRLPSGDISVTVQGGKDAENISLIQLWNETEIVGSPNSTFTIGKPYIFSGDSMKKGDRALVFAIFKDHSWQIIADTRL